LPLTLCNEPCHIPVHAKEAVMAKKSETFGSRLASIRESRGLSQAELARRAELHPSFISQLEANKRKGNSHETLRKLTVALKVDLATLLGA